MFWAVIFLARILPTDARQATLTMTETLAALVSRPAADGGLNPSAPSTE